MTSLDDDDIDREISAALAIEPSADFVARVRRRLAQRAGENPAGVLRTVAVLSGFAAVLAAITFMPSSPTPETAVLPVEAQVAPGLDRQIQPPISIAASPVSIHTRQRGRARVDDTDSVTRTDTATEALDQYLHRLYGPSVGWMKFPTWQTAPDISPASIAIKVDPLEIEALDRTAQ